MWVLRSLVVIDFSMPLISLSSYDSRSRPVGRLCIVPRTRRTLCAVTFSFALLIRTEFLLPSQHRPVDSRNIRIIIVCFMQHILRIAIDVTHVIDVHGSSCDFASFTCHFLVVLCFRFLFVWHHTSSRRVSSSCLWAPVRDGLPYAFSDLAFELALKFRFVLIFASWFVCRSNCAILKFHL
jgi:hypothetical protein